MRDQFISNGYIIDDIKQTKLAALNYLKEKGVTNQEAINYLGKLKNYYQIEQEQYNKDRRFK
jgi:hypothetical protein